MISTEDEREFFKNLHETVQNWLSDEKTETVELTRQEWHNIANILSELQKDPYTYNLKEIDRSLALEIKKQIGHPEENLEMVENDG